MANQLLAEGKAFVHTLNGVWQKSEVGGRRSEAGGRKSEAGGRKPEVGGRRKAEIALAGLRGGTAQPGPDFLGVLFVERVGQFPERMAHDHFETFPVHVRDAMLERRAVDIKSGREIALHAKDGVAHQTHPAPAGRGFGDIRRFFQPRFEQAFAERGRFFHGFMGHGAHRFLEMPEPAILLEESDRDDGRPDEGVRIDVSGVADPGVENRDAQVPNEEQGSDEPFGEKAMKRWFAERVCAGGDHQQAENEQAGVDRVHPDREVADEKIEHAPDDSEHGGFADFLPGANDKEGLVFSQGEERLSLHEPQF